MVLDTVALVLRDNVFHSADVWNGLGFFEVFKLIMFACGFFCRRIVTLNVNCKMRTMQSCFDTIIFVATYSQVSKLEINFDKPNKSSAVA